MKIKKTALATISTCALLSLTTTALAQESKYGLGGIVGSPTGITFKLNLNERNALDFALGFGFLAGSHFYLHAQYLWDINLLQLDRANMDFYFGVGPKFGAFTAYDGEHNGRGLRRRSGAALGVRVPLGLDFPFKSRPLDVFVELAPGLWFINDVDFSIDAAVGARYWF